MKITLTVSEIFETLGLWDKVCELKGLNPWAVNEGLMDSSEELTFDEEECEKLGIKIAE